MAETDAADTGAADTGAADTGAADRGAAETVGDWLALLDAHYPPAHALSWDHVGLQVGDPAWPVARVLVSLDVTGAVVREAVDGPPNPQGVARTATR